MSCYGRTFSMTWFCTSRRVSMRFNICQRVGLGHHQYTDLWWNVFEMTHFGYRFVVISSNEQCYHARNVLLSLNIDVSELVFEFIFLFQQIIVPTTTLCLEKDCFLRVCLVRSLKSWQTNIIDSKLVQKYNLWHHFVWKIQNKSIRYHVIVTSVIVFKSYY